MALNMCKVKTYTMAYNAPIYWGIVGQQKIDVIIQTILKRRLYSFIGILVAKYISKVLRTYITRRLQTHTECNVY